jgi:hypothetical protein
MFIGGPAAATIGIRDIGIARVRRNRTARPAWLPARVSA